MTDFSFINNDGTFFSITSPDIQSFPKTITSDVISFSINEEMGQMISGSLQLKDQNLLYSKILLPYKRLIISWGIQQKWSSIPTKCKRENVEVFIQSPSGGGAQSGLTTYNCSFMSLGMRGDINRRTFINVTKTVAIQQVFTGLGVDMSYIQFQRGAESLTWATALRQDETDFNFLVRCAYEWHAIFMLGFTSTGKLAGCFCDRNLVASSPYMTWVGANSAGYFSYGGANYNDSLIPVVGKKANVMSYTWKQETSSAMGDNVRIVMVNGQPNFIRMVASGETVTAYRLVPELIQKELNSLPVAQRAARYAQMMSATNFSEVKKYFEPYRQSLAPQGSGFTINIECLGNPYLTSGTIATFGDGFPPRIGGTDRTWFIRKVGHTISKSGYFSSVEIQDVYNLLTIQ